MFFHRKRQKSVFTAKSVCFFFLLPKLIFDISKLYFDVILYGSDGGFPVDGREGRGESPEFHPQCYTCASSVFVHVENTVKA